MKPIKSRLCALFLLISVCAQAQDAGRWADSVLSSLSAEEKIAQLIMVRLSSIDGKSKKIIFYDSTVEADIRKYNIGGICLFQGAPVKQSSLVNHFQSIAKTPILMAIDGENGVGMRVDSVAGLPRMMMLGAVRDSLLAYRYGQWVGEQCRQMGIQVNFAPVADVNNNPNNPVINDRSFGENKYTVASLAVQYMLGMKSRSVMGSAKHFPGHGDVDVDSHYAMPIINKSKLQLDSLELYPFKKLFEAGIGSTMVAHLFIPSLDSGANRVSSVSRKSVTGLLREELGFMGITFTDALEMKGVADAFPGGSAAVESIIAGNDMLCLPGEVSMVIASIKAAINDKKITWEQIDARVLNVLKAKHATGLASWTPVALEGLAMRLNEKTDALKKEIAEQAITLVRYTNKDAFPLASNRKGNIALLEIGRSRNSSFALAVRSAYNATVFSFDNSRTAEQADSVLALLQEAPYEKIIIALHDLSRFPANNFTISQPVMDLVNKVAAAKPSSLFLFGNPYAAKYFCTLNNIITCYDDDPITQAVAAKMMQGELSPQGQLPVSVCENMPVGTGITVTPFAEARSRWVDPTAEQQAAMATAAPKLSTAGRGFFDVQKSRVIDSIINDAIARKAAPGMALLVVKDGKVIHEKTYGNLGYDSKEKISQETVWDMASVTKICATTLSIMKLYDEGKIALDNTLGDYMPWVRGSDKAGLKIRDILLHQAGLKAFIPFYKEIADSVTNKPLPGYFSNKQDEKFGVKVDEAFYMRTAWKDTLFSRILTSTLAPNKPYIYSDNDFIFLGELVKSVTGQPLDEYAWNSFYRPLGFSSTGFNPTRFISSNTIAPTEQDPYFRERMVRGFVHDPGAAMFGGVSGHAGLFSNAYEIAVLMQLLMNKGVINGKRFFKASTIDLFTAYQSTISRRGLGFDKPEKDNRTRKIPYPALQVSDATFGHTGFTGTCTWADPEKGIVFVLHANRVHPIAKNIFGDLNVRGKVMEQVFRKETL